LHLNALSTASSPAARICRSISYETMSDPRTDTCTIEGVIDRRDGWPITLVISRRGESVSGDTETKSRRFDRVAPLQGYVAPANPCLHGR